MASVMTAEFVGTGSQSEPAPFSLIEQKGLLPRLAQEVASAARELARDPRGFIIALFSSDSRDAKRRRRIYAGLAFAVVAHATLLTFIAVVGWRTVFVKQVEQEDTGYVVIPLSPGEKTEPDKRDVAAGKGKGGGGGGQQQPKPASEGRPPRMMPIPQIARMNPSSIPEPSLPVPPTLVGTESPPPPPATIGDPAGKGKEFSGGPGSKGGIGSGEGSGVGGGKDSGAGPGSRGGKDGGPAGSPDASGSNIPKAIDFNRIGSFPGYKSWTWIRRQQAIVTPEAQANKVIGIVALRANFNADGTITDIEVAMPVDFMTESAIEALRRSTFRPATNNGVPVTVRRVLIQIAVHY